MLKCTALLVHMDLFVVLSFNEFIKPIVDARVFCPPTRKIQDLILFSLDMNHVDLKIMNSCQIDDFPHAFLKFRVFTFAFVYHRTLLYIYLTLNHLIITVPPQYITVPPQYITVPPHPTAMTILYE